MSVADPFTATLQAATGAQIEKAANTSALTYARFKLVSSVRGGLASLVSGHAEVTLRGEREQFAALLQVLDACPVGPVIRAKLIRAMETGAEPGIFTLCAAEIQAIAGSLVSVAIFDVEILFPPLLKREDRSAFRGTRELWFVGERGA